MNEGKSIRLEVADGFYLSPIVRTDKAAYLEHFADPEIAQNLLAIPFPYTEADADSWLDRCEKSVAAPITNFALRAPSGYLIGAIGMVGALSTNADNAEFGYWLAKSYRGRGLMRGAQNLVGRMPRAGAAYWGGNQEPSPCPSL